MAQLGTSGSALDSLHCMKHDEEWARRAQTDLRVLFNNWDPIGVVDPEGTSGEAGPTDEYDCIRDPLVSHLLRGDNRAQVTAFLEQELAHHFGLEPRLVTTAIIDRIFAWWASAA